MNNYNGNPNKIIFSSFLSFLNIIILNFNITFFESNYNYLKYYIVNYEHIKQIILFNIQPNINIENSLYLLFFLFNIIFSLINYKYFHTIFNKIIISLKFITFCNLFFSLFNIHLKNSHFFIIHFYNFNYLFLISIINFIITVISSFIKIKLFFIYIKQKLDLYIFNTIATISGVYYFTFLFYELQNFNIINVFYYIFIFYLVIMVTFNFTIFCNIKSTNIFYPFSFGMATAAFFIFKKINIGETYYIDYYILYYINEMVTSNFYKKKHTYYNLIKNSFPIIISFNFYGFQKIIFISFFYSITLFFINIINHYLLSNKSSFVKIYKKDNHYFYKNNKLFMENYCTICLENYNCKQIIAILDCNHVFHKKCIHKWLSNKNMCPICRNIHVENLYLSTYQS